MEGSRCRRVSSLAPALIRFSNGNCQIIVIGHCAGKGSHGVEIINNEGGGPGKQHSEREKIGIIRLPPNLYIHAVVEGNDPNGYLAKPTACGRSVPRSGLSTFITAALYLFSAHHLLFFWSMLSRLAAEQSHHHGRQFDGRDLHRVCNWHGLPACAAVCSVAHWRDSWLAA